MGWRAPWYSSFGSDFNYDFHVTLDEAVAPVEYNYRDKAELVQKGETYFTQGESHGLSVFLRDDDNVFHTYSTYARASTCSTWATTTSTSSRRVVTKRPSVAAAGSDDATSTLTPKLRRATEDYARVTAE
jgi:predicted dithiol-disulfide oxidoreductase (DUF899 family)